MADETTSQPTITHKLVPLVWSEPGVAIFANHAAAQYDGNLVYLTFGQAQPPFILGQTEEEKQRQLDGVQAIAIRPVICLAMTPQDFRAVGEVFQKHLALIDRITKQEQK